MRHEPFEHPGQREQQEQRPRGGNEHSSSRNIRDHHGTCGVKKEGEVGKGQAGDGSQIRET